MKDPAIEGVTFSHYFFEIVRRVYVWKCLERGLWPSADPRFLRNDISQRFEGLDRCLKEIDSASDRLARWELVRRLVAQEMG